MGKKEDNQEMEENLPSSIDEINTKKFHEKINEIQEFSKSIPSDSDLPIVPTSGGLFGLFEHKVTGNELNELTGKIQSMMIAQNKESVKVIKEFETIYETFDELNKSYMQGIIASLKSAEEANRKALEGLNGVEKNTREIENDQIEIKKIIRTQETALEILQSFKRKLDEIEHILDIDQLFSDVERLNNELYSFQKEIEKSNEEFNEFVEQKFLQFDHKIEKRHLSMQNEISSIIMTQKSESHDIKELIDKNSRETNVISNELNQKLAKTDNEIESVIQSVSELTQQLRLTKIAATSGFGIIVILIILIFSGVL